MIPKLINFASNHNRILINNDEYFTSYNSTVARSDEDNFITLYQDWDYSRTTVKYLSKWLKITGGKKTIQSKINSGEYRLID